MKKILKRIQRRLIPHKKSLEVQDMTLLLFIVLIIVIFFYIFFQQMEFIAKYWDYLIDPQNLKLYVFLLMFPLIILIKIQEERRKRNRKFKFKFLGKQIKKNKKRK